MTADAGATWRDVTPPDLKPFMKVSIVDAGHFDAQTASPRSTRCASTTCARTSIARTTAARPGRRSSTASPTARPVDAVREDPKRQGLLFAGTEREVYVSFDDGEHWQSLRLNMPATSIATSSSKVTISSPARTAAVSGFSTTSRRSVS